MNISTVTCVNGQKYMSGNFFDYPCGSDHVIIKAELNEMNFYTYNMVHVVDVFQSFFKRLTNFKKTLKDFLRQLIACYDNTKCSDFYKDVLASSLNEYIEFIKCFDTVDNMKLIITKLSEIPQDNKNATSEFIKFIKYNKDTNIYIDDKIKIHNSVLFAIKQFILCNKDNILETARSINIMGDRLFDLIQQLFSTLLDKNFVYRSIIRKLFYFMETMNRLFDDDNSYLVLISEYDKTDKYFDLTSKNFKKSDKGYRHIHANNYISDCNITKTDDFKNFFDEYNHHMINFITKDKEHNVNECSICADAYTFSSECAVFYNECVLDEVDYTQAFDEKTTFPDELCTLYLSLFNVISSKETYVVAISLKYRNGALNYDREYFNNATNNKLYLTLQQLKSEFIGDKTLYFVIGGDFNNMYMPEFNNNRKKDAPWELGQWYKTVNPSNIHNQLQEKIKEILGKITEKTHEIDFHTNDHNEKDIMKMFIVKITPIKPNLSQEGGYYDKYIKYKTKYLQLKDFKTVQDIY